MEKVTGLYFLELLVEYKKSVVCPNAHAWRKPHPAAFMINLPGVQLLRLFEGGMYVYNKPN